MQNSLTRKPIEVKISTVVAVAVILNESLLSSLELALKEMTGGSPDFFDDEFAIIDVESIAAETLDWPAIIALFKSCGLHAVAVRNAAEEQHATIRAHGLSIDVVSKAKPELPREQQEAPEIQKPVTATPMPTAVEHIPAMIIDTPVRAGQRVYARGCDLIVTASVNNGAEVIADGSIHIYAPLRGRALAGARGNTNARIFVTSMEAELVSIAGIYQTFDSGFPKLSPNQPIQIKLVGDSIEVSSLKST
ncbi:septum site-determining protein MinC [Undibacterium fentianense]|uniref:Probable septum site-determining protein MinC n=1 Tax=Undibacterium fentianense TaxID=2828728 RepID=A0A941EAV0_9BURK|nr:septum site-determining protein MinC [Undibacterium fentianense]MBR7801713.1 septum site-determining protein MinC [Undibacterium fentianense]